MTLSTLTKYNQVPTSSALYWPNRTKYQPVPPYTDLWNQVTTNAAMPLSIFYWPSTPKYQQVLPSTDPVPPRTNQYLKKYQLADLRGIILMHIKGRVWPGLPVIFRAKSWMRGGGGVGVLKLPNLTVITLFFGEKWHIVSKMYVWGGGKPI